MDLNSFERFDATFKKTIILVVSIVFIFAVAFIASYYFIASKIEDLYTKALVIDTKGNVYEANPITASYMREYEYENHVKTFVGLWYAFDENNYEENINKALNLIGETGKELLNQYNDVSILNNMKQKNLRYNVSIKDIHIDMQTIPISGNLQITQTGYRARGSLSRDMQIEFTLYDVSRSRENIHGCKIDKWSVKYSKPYSNGKEDEEEQK